MTKIPGRNHLKEGGFFKPIVQRVPFIIGGSDRWLEWFGTWDGNQCCSFSYGADQGAES